MRGLDGHRERELVKTFLAGALVRVSVTFTRPGTDPDGNPVRVPADPDTVTLRYQPFPGADITQINYPGDTRIVREDTGAYHSDLDTTGLPGDEFTYVWEGTGNVQAAAEGTFLVQVQFA